MSRRPPWARRARTALVLLAAAVLTTGCRLDVHVVLDVRPDGSGTVAVAGALDDEAAARVPQLAAQLEVGDLVAAGWDVSGPVEEGDGRTWVRATKPFATPEEAGVVVTEVSGRDGPFRDFQVTRDPSLLRDRWRASGTVDLRDGLAAFSDEAVRQRLDGTNVGVPDDEVAPRGQALADTFTFRLEISLPGDVRADPAAGEGPTWTPRLGERLELEATGTRWNAAVVAWLAVAGTSAAAAVLALVRGLRRRRRPIGAHATRHRRARSHHVG